MTIIKTIMPKRILLTLTAFFAIVTSASAQKDVSIFHRLLITNAQNELLVIKIENTDFWVTPGLYQDKFQSVRQGLDSIANSYGLEVSKPNLKGVFLLKRDLGGKLSASLRNVYTTEYKSGSLKAPPGIDEMKWLPINEALQTITFPHINEMIKPISENPDEVWGGTLLQYKDGENWRVDILEEFYIF